MRLHCAQKRLGRCCTDRRRDRAGLWSNESSATISQAEATRPSPTNSTARTSLPVSTPARAEPGTDPKTAGKPALPTIPQLTETEIRKLIDSLGDIAAALAAGAQADKANLHPAFHLDIRYRPRQQLGAVQLTSANHAR